MEEFRGSEVAKILSIEPTSIPFWVRCGWIIPGIKIGKRGSHHLFTRNDIYRMVLLKAGMIPLKLWAEHVKHADFSQIDEELRCITFQLGRGIAVTLDLQNIKEETNKKIKDFQL